MTAEERKNDYELRQLARERNKAKAVVNGLCTVGNSEKSQIFPGEDWKTLELLDSHYSVSNAKHHLHSHSSCDAPDSKRQSIPESDSNHIMLGAPVLLFCTLLNAQSLVNKLNHLQLFLSKNEPDLLFVTETWLTCKIKNSEVSSLFVTETWLTLSSRLPYDVVRLDRSDKRGGGVCCVIKNTLTSRIVRHDIRSKADVLCVDILPHYGYSPFRFVIVYRPPDSLISDDENLIELLATFISTERETVVREPTHENRILDLILTTTPSITNVSLMPPLSSSDHWVLLYLSLPMPDYHNVDYASVDNSLHNVDWFTVFKGYDSMSDLYRKICTTTASQACFYEESSPIYPSQNE
ncbi:hypothetical protein COOONC_11551 [Cooperia oncophora]